MGVRQAICTVIPKDKQRPRDGWLNGSAEEAKAVLATPHPSDTMVAWPHPAA